MSRSLQRYQVLAAGVLSLIVTVGVARFAYTPLLPIMQQQTNLGLSEGGWLAAINFVGYFCGALLASMISSLQLKDRLYRWGLLLAVISTAGMAMTEQLWLWALWRFVGGLSSAAGMLLAAGLILNWQIRNNHRHELGIHFAGVGLGIVFCALLVELLSQLVDWRGQWWWLTLAAALLAIPAWRWLPRPEPQTQQTAAATMADNPPGRLFLRIMLAAYFCAGVGYVISTTFIVAIVKELPGLEGQGGWVFLVMGLAAIPTSILWDLIARRLGTLNSLALASVIQIVGILLPLVNNQLIWSMLGSVLFGGTFVGMVSLVLAMAGRYYPSSPAKMMGKMTLAYGSAQILAPAVTGMLAEHSGSYSIGLYLAAAVMVLGTLLLLVAKQIERTDHLPQPNSA